MSEPEQIARDLNESPQPERVRLGAELGHPCPDCGGKMVLRDSVHGLFYGCRAFPRCKATHGAHKATGQPLGTPADTPTKRARQAAHVLFDQLWKGKALRGRHRGHPEMKRGEAYAWMAEAMGLTKDEAHIGLFNAEQCEQLRELLREHFPGLTESLPVT